MPTIGNYKSRVKQKIKVADRCMKCGLEICYQCMHKITAVNIEKMEIDNAGLLCPKCNLELELFLKNRLTVKAGDKTALDRKLTNYIVEHPFMVKEQGAL